MDLKNVLKNLKMNENNISMLLGAAVIVIVGFLIVNYFKTLESGTALPTTSTTANENAKVTLPTKHMVSEGETLWSIAEKYYKSGYNWIDIQKANNLTNASVITKGQEITIPDVEARVATVKEDQMAATAAATTKPVIAEATPTVTVTATPEATKAPEEVITTTKGGEAITATTTSGERIEGTSYTVVHGDSLWKIAERAYGDGYKWVEIAKANNLLHPGIIHSGNTLTLPR